MKISLLIPTFNAGNLWPGVLQGIDEQRGVSFSRILVDSGSKDDTVNLAIQHHFSVKTISQSQFNHGATRQLLADEAGDTDILVFLTQDAILASPESVATLVAVFEDEKVGMAYGRQLPHINAQPLEAHARYYNYPSVSKKVSIEDVKTLGFRAFFSSDSFAAYRASSLREVGGFPLDSIMGEDAIVAAKMLSAGYKKAYVAEATVHHSHSYTLSEEFRRFFDTRVFHEQNIWMIKKFGKPTGEGMKFIKSELLYAIKNSPSDIFKSAFSLFAKFFGYQTGRLYRKFSTKTLKKLSMHSFYWK